MSICTGIILPEMKRARVTPIYKKMMFIISVIIDQSQLYHFFSKILEQNRESVLKIPCRSCMIFAYIMFLTRPLLPLGKLFSTLYCVRSMVSLYSWLSWPCKYSIQFDTILFHISLKTHQKIFKQISIN